MSHAAAQIRDWFITTLDGVVSLPTPTAGEPRQIPDDTEAVFVRTTSEEVALTTMGTGELISERVLTVEVGLIARTYTLVDVLGVLAEEGLAASVTYPGKDIQLTGRNYDRNTETDREYVGLTLTYAATYYVEDVDVETFK